MVDVTRENFATVFPDVEGSILEADFIALDAEFTGLNTGPSNKYSLFDNEDERFKKVLRGSLDSLIIQLGLSCFKYEESERAYRARSWTFNVFPKSFGSLEFPFTCSGDSIKFLVRNNFDFNKVGGDLNDVQENCLEREIEITNIMQSLSPDEEDELQEIRFQLSEGIRNKMVFDCSKFLSPYVLHMEVRTRHNSLWSRSLDSEQVEVYRVNPEDRARLVAESNGEEGIKKEFMDEYIGLTKVIQTLRRAKKPLVGHNCLLDLAKLYHQFISPLSNFYESFKKEILKEFPIIFDTKHLIASLRKELSSHDMRDVSKLLMKSKLSSLYELLDGNLWKFGIFFEPIIMIDDVFTGPQDRYHVAGYDSFVTGKVFLYLAHISSSIPFNKWNYHTPLNFSGHLTAIRKWKNKLFFAKSCIPCWDLESEEVFKLPLLHVTVKDVSITPMKLSNMFCQYGRVEIKSILPGRFLLVCQRDLMLKSILKEQSQNSRIEIVPYENKVHSLTWILAEGMFVMSFGSALGLSVYNYCLLF